jgi:site-specific recombinase XerD
VAAFVAACRAAVLSERTIEFYLEALNSYRAFAGGALVDLTLADLQLDRARAWLADFVQRGRKPATVAARARALRVFSHWTVTDRFVRTDPLENLKVPKIPRTIVETFTADQMTALIAAAPAPLAITLKIFIDTGPSASARRPACGSPTSGTGSSGYWARAVTSGPSPTAEPSTPRSAAT